ncbi:ABC transporter permease [Salinicoccus sp. HZC-1]|uniref:ABC transporter permease n=1 Tax=Salinicoccus sp. HZC-1 TaxID=3385497 RepID=UPI00398A9F43
MNNLMRAELFKLRHNKSFWTILLFSVGLSALLHYLVITDWWMMQNTPFDAAGLSDFNALSMFVIPLYFNLMTGTLAAFFISTEFGNSGVIKNQIISGKNRSLIYLAKYIVYTLGAVIIAVLLPLLVGVMLNLVMGNGDIFNGETVTYLVRAYLLFILQFAGYAAFITLLAILTEDSGKTIILSVLFTIILFTIEKMPMPAFVDFLYDHSVFQQFNLVLAPEMSAGGIVEAVIVGLLTIIVMLLVGIFAFNRKEIK